ncbi:MAG: DinB family protein [Anaerolineales bacterium]
MTHPLVTQLRFARKEFQRGLTGLSAADAQRRLPPMNCISWNVGHLAWQEQKCFLFGGQKRILFPDVDVEFAYGAPASTPEFGRVQKAWKAVTEAVDPWLDGLSESDMKAELDRGEGFGRYRIGNLLLRVIYHYWYHNGENLGIRQALGHTDLPQFVGNIDEEAPYRAA